MSGLYFSRIRTRFDQISHSAPVVVVQKWQCWCYNNDTQKYERLLCCSYMPHGEENVTSFARLPPLLDSIPGRALAPPWTLEDIILLVIFWRFYSLKAWLGQYDPVCMTVKNPSNESSNTISVVVTSYITGTKWHCVEFVVVNRRQFSVATAVLHALIFTNAHQSWSWSNYVEANVVFRRVSIRLAHTVMLCPTRLEVKWTPITKKTYGIHSPPLYIHLITALTTY